MSAREMPVHVGKAMRFEYPHLKKHAKKNTPISHKTIFYMKEYGPHSHIAARIIHESLRVLLAAAVITSLGGLTLEGVKGTILSVAPLLILLPALNDMIGDFGIVIAGRFSTMLLEGKVASKPLHDKEIQKLFLQVLLSALVVCMIASSVAITISYFSGLGVDTGTALKVMGIALLDVLILICLIFIVSVFAGIYFLKQGEDPNNFLIPVVTSVADFTNILVLCGLAMLFL